MTMRLIDADALLERENYNPFFLTGARNGKGLFSACKAYLQMTVESAPTIEAEPVKRGRWVVRGGKRYCSVCKERACVTRDMEDFWYTVGTRFCPNCGAKLDLKEV